jgi:hypothetical protein
MDRVERITSIINLMASSRAHWRVTELVSELKIDKSSIPGEKAMGKKTPQRRIYPG